MIAFILAIAAFVLIAVALYHWLAAFSKRSVAALESFAHAHGAKFEDGKVDGLYEGLAFRAELRSEYAFGRRTVTPVLSVLGGQLMPECELLYRGPMGSRVINRLSGLTMIHVPGFTAHRLMTANPSWLARTLKPEVLEALRQAKGLSFRITPEGLVEAYPVTGLQTEWTREALDRALVTAAILWRAGAATQR